MAKSYGENLKPRNNVWKMVQSVVYIEFAYLHRLFLTHLLRFNQSSIHELCNPFRRRRDIPGYRERMLGRSGYLRLKAVAMDIDCERGELKEKTLP